MLLDKQNRNTVEAFTAATTTGVYSKPPGFKKEGGGYLLGGKLLPFYVGEEKQADGPLDFEIVEQIDESRVGEMQDAQGDPGHHNRGHMDGLRKGELLLARQRGCEVHPKTPLRGAGKKEER